MENEVDMAKYTDSDSSVQCEIENILFCKIQSELNLKLEKNPVISLTGNCGTKIQPDFYSAEAKVIDEIHSHMGKLKPAQLHKVEADILKMLLIEKVYGEKFAKYIVVCSEEEEKQLQGSSFLAEAISQFEIKVRFFELSEEYKTKLENAMKKQNLIKSCGE